MEPLDGNAIAGLLLEAFGTEMTTAIGVCAGCGAAGPLAEQVVYLRAPGVVVRCRGCTAVLLVVTERRGTRCVDVSGFAALDAAAAPG